MNIKKKTAALIYHAIAKHMPRSYSSVPIMQTELRRFCGKILLDHCGKNVNIEKNALFSSKVSLGDYSGIGVNAKIYGCCKIGDYVMMGEDVTIITRNHCYNRCDIPMMHQDFEQERPVIIGNDVWIGDRCIILPGVHIGDGAIIGAGSVVTHDVLPYTIVAGNPARLIKHRMSEKSEGLKDSDSL